MQKFHSQWPCGVSKFGRQRQHDNDTNFMPSGFCCTWRKSLRAGTDVIRWWSPCSWLLRRRWSQSWCFFDDHWSGPCTKPRYSCCGRKETTEGCRQVSAGAGGNIRCNARCRWQYQVQTGSGITALQRFNQTSPKIQPQYSVSRCWCAAETSPLPLGASQSERRAKTFLFKATDKATDFMRYYTRIQISHGCRFYEILHQILNISLLQIFIF